MIDRSPRQPDDWSGQGRMDWLTWYEALDAAQHGQDDDADVQS